MLSTTWGKREECEAAFVLCVGQFLPPPSPGAPGPFALAADGALDGLADGPRAGLAILEPVLASGALTDYGPLHAAHADLLDRLGDADAAAAAWARAIEATENTALRAELQRRVADRSRDKSSR